MSGQKQTDVLLPTVDDLFYLGLHHLRGVDIQELLQFAEKIYASTEEEVQMQSTYSGAFLSRQAALSAYHRHSPFKLRKTFTLPDGTTYMEPGLQAKHTPDPYHRLMLMYKHMSPEKERCTREYMEWLKVQHSATLGEIKRVNASNYRKRKLNGDHVVDPLPSTKQQGEEEGGEEEKEEEPTPLE